MLNFGVIRDKFRRKLGKIIFDKNKNKNKNILLPIKSILFVRWDAKIGDSIVSSFMFREIKKFDPGIKISILTTPTMKTFFKDNFMVDNIEVIEKRPSYKKLLETSKKFSKQDLVVFLNSNMKMKDIYFLNKIKAVNIAGLDDSLNLVNIKLGKKTSKMHFADKIKTCLEAVNIPIKDAKYEIPQKDDSYNFVDEYLLKNKIKDYIVFNPYGSGAQRKMSATTIKKFISYIKKYASNQIIILSSPETRIMTERVVNNINDLQVIHFSSSRNIYDIIAIIASADKVITVDTAIAHIATGLDKRQFVIYSTDQNNYNSWHPNSNLADSFFINDVNPANVNNLNWNKLEMRIKQLLK